jgi:5-(carboxyamino)imidazole ribonucleotide mutase
MPKGVPVATFAIGEAGAANAALFCASIFADSDIEIQKKLNQFRSNQVDMVMNMKLGKE